ncbi:glucose sorbosone dehydrogenase [Microcella alkaliphila]|uniref:Glucose sorbosone dehydrogenase n=1 Tax=Microcella alkaliphila TaxID=279828 RepID=A0A0U4WTX1_9MICO|nr:glucose sorbosone dehydrogenase [Microcella alkaliphila]
MNLIEPGGNYGWPVVEGIGGDDRNRDALLGSDGRLWFLTNNTDGRGSPGAEDDRLLAVELSPAS